jgi:hypothetical protein
MGIPGLSQSPRALVAERTGVNRVDGSAYKDLVTGERFLREKRTLQVELYLVGLLHIGENLIKKNRRNRHYDNKELQDNLATELPSIEH